MLVRPSSFRLLAMPALIALALLADRPLRQTPAADAPKAKPYALLYLPKKRSLDETNQFRRRQIALIKTNTTAPFVLAWAIRSLKNTDLPSLPKKGKAGDNGFETVEDVAWLEQHLQVEDLDGTGVLRIALTAGSPREQALLVNAVVHEYFRINIYPEQELSRKHLVGLQRQLKIRKELAATAQGEEKKGLERGIAATQDSIARHEFGLRTSPQLLELAEVPPE